MRIHILLLALILQLLSLALCVNYLPCNNNSPTINRNLHILTCDTRHGMKEYSALAYWNTSLWKIHQQGGKSKNVCSGRPWNGFITKPRKYLDYMHEQILNSPKHVQQFAILMDSDTMFSGVTSMNDIWRKYDCARKDRDIVLATETSCWIGQYCTPDNITQYYPPSFLEAAPSFSPFANSGVIMGSMKALIKMLEYVIEHNASYYLRAPHQRYKYKFDDQFAYADYCLKVKADNCMLDYHQSIAASISLTFQDVSDPRPKSWPFVCKLLDNTISYHCPDVTWGVYQAGYITIDEQHCGIIRKWVPNEKSSSEANYMYKQQLLSLDPSPLIYHGNGAGKHLLIRPNALGGKSFDCLLRKYRGMNVTEYYDINTFKRDYSSDVP